MPTVRSTTDSSPLLLNILYLGSCHQRLFMPGTTDCVGIFVHLLVSTPSGPSLCFTAKCQAGVQLWRELLIENDKLLQVCAASLTLCVPVCSYRFQFIVPKKWRRDRPVCMHLAGTGDHVRTVLQCADVALDWSGRVALSDPAAWSWPTRQNTTCQDPVEMCPVVQNHTLWLFVLESAP